MQPIFWSPDLRILPLLRALEKLKVGGDWSIIIGGEEPQGQACLKSSDLLSAMMSRLGTYTRFGRLAVVAKGGLGETSEADLRKAYLVSDKRGEEVLQCRYFEMPGLSDLAYVGLGGSVEFRRLARKYIRKAKQAHCDTLFLADPILAETRTKKVLQHIAGSQIRVYCLDEVVEAWGVQGSGQVNYSFEGVGLSDKLRVEQILQRKFKDGAFRAR